MTVRELEELLGKGGRRHMMRAYKTKSYLDQARFKNLNVTPERISAIVESIEQQEKELKSIKTQVKKEL